MIDVGRSFLRRHPHFEGDVAVIHDGLCDASRGVLQALSERLRQQPVGAALRGRVARLPPSFTAPRRAQLHSLDAFRLEGYRKVLLCDADLLFREPVDELFAWKRSCWPAATARICAAGAATPSALPRPATRTPSAGRSTADSS